MMNSKAFSFCTDIGYLSVNKHDEQLCGDHVELVEQDENSIVFVLADGLGSGVKASILSTLTSKIISTMMANSMSVEDCVATMAATLPVCEVRKVAYSTFTIIRVVNNKEAEIIQYENHKSDRRQDDIYFKGTAEAGRYLYHHKRRRYLCRRRLVAQFRVAER